jgi:hypothetical protein
MNGLDLVVNINFKKWESFNFNLWTVFEIGSAGNYYSSDGKTKPEYGELADLTRKISTESENDIKGHNGSMGVFFTKM